MSVSILGNNNNPNYFSTTQYMEVEDDDGEYYEIEIQAEPVEETNVMGYRWTVPKNSDSQKAVIGYYYLKPTSEWYWDYMYGDTPYPVTPVVYACDSNWKITECLNVPLSQHSMEGLNSGWIRYEITLTRKLVKGEKILFGIYSNQYTYVWSNKNDLTGNCYIFYSKKNTYSWLSNPPAVISQVSYYGDFVHFKMSEDVCVYLEYENEPDSRAYVYNVTGTIGAKTAASKKFNSKRSLSPVISNKETLKRTTQQKRQNESASYLLCNAGRKEGFFRNYGSSFLLSETTEQRRSIFRNAVTFLYANYAVNRKAGLNKSFSEELDFTEQIETLKVIICKVEHGLEIIDDNSRYTELKRLGIDVADFGETTERRTSLFREYLEEMIFDDMPFASRIFYRTCVTVLGFWDWLRGKIREANNIVSVYCPIDLEIELECKI